MSILSTLITLVLVVGIFVGAYYVSKYVAVGYNKNTVYGQSIVEIIERKPISRDQSLLVVKISEKVILLGVSPQNIQEISTFNSEDFEVKEPIEVLEKTKTSESFKDIFNKYTNKSEK
ncbi:MAG: flagellar biosynthetic protein FliO [Clostridia bacterium]